MRGRGRRPPTAVRPAPPGDARRASRSSCCRRGARMRDRCLRVRGCRLPRSSAQAGSELTWSVSFRLCSSGIVRSKLRRPDSMCATGIESLTAASAAASVELTSPATTTRSGRSTSKICATPSSARAVCSPWSSRADLETNVGHGKPELVDEDIRHFGVVVLAGVNEANADARVELAECLQHGSRLHEVGARTDHEANLRSHAPDDGTPTDRQPVPPAPGAARPPSRSLRSGGGGGRSPLLDLPGSARLDTCPLSALGQARCPAAPAPYAAGRRDPRPLP